MCADVASSTSVPDAAAGDHDLLGYPIARYQARHQLDDLALAAQLGVAPHRLKELLACPRPWGDPYGIWLGQIAAAFDADVEALAAIVGLW